MIFRKSDNPAGIFGNSATSREIPAAGPKRRTAADDLPRMNRADLAKAREAVVLAEKAAPYMHAKLTSSKQAVSGTLSLEQLVLRSMRGPEPTD